MCCLLTVFVCSAENLKEKKEREREREWGGDGYYLLPSNHYTVPPNKTAQITESHDDLSENTIGCLTLAVEGSFVLQH